MLTSAEKLKKESSERNRNIMKLKGSLRRDQRRLINLEIRRDQVSRVVKKGGA